MTSKEFDVMMAEALTIIGRNVPSLKNRFARIGDWRKDTVRNHAMIATCGPLSIAFMLDEVVESRENTGKILPSYISSIAANLRRMASVGDRGNRHFSMPTSIPDREIRSYCDLLRRHGSTVCRTAYFERFGAEGIRKALAERGCDVNVTIVDNYFEPMTVTEYENDGSGYARVAAVMPTVKLTLLNKEGAN